MSSLEVSALFLLPGAPLVLLAHSLALILTCLALFLLLPETRGLSFTQVDGLCPTRDGVWIVGSGFAPTIKNLNLEDRYDRAGFTYVD